jgi:hypothetical protein
LVAALSAVLGLFGCRRPPAAPTVRDLQFPVLMVTDQVGVKECPTLDDLTNLHSNYLDLSRGERRLVVDSRLRIFEMLNLRSAKSPFIRMITGPGRTPVLFELSETAGGISAVRNLLVACRYLSTDSDQTEQARRAIQKAETMSELITVLHAAQ